jgi:hypothetical protein
MSYPFRENLEVVSDSAGTWIHCSRCRHPLCRAGADWKLACKKRTFPSTKAGALMADLMGTYLLEKIYCPSCGALMDSDLIEAGGR